VKEINVVCDAIEKGQMRIDNPTNLGNEAATIEDILQDTSSLSSESTALQEHLLKGNKEDLIESLNGVMATSRQLFDDVKGVSRKIDDSEARQKLLDAVRAAGSAISNLLNSVKNVSTKPNDEEEKKVLGKNVDSLKQKLNDVDTAARDSEKAAPEDNEDLEALAEKELLEAARAIEEAAKSLLATKQQPKLISGDVNVADAILDAALAITKATSMLVIAAAAAQKERVEKGRVSGGSVYKKDPTWSQGLISAAKAVASTTAMLIETANKAVSGEIEEEAVIAASKAVAGATAQLIAATRAKADDLNSPAQIKLNTAAGAVTKATSMLVAAAKAVSKNSQQIVNDTNTSEFQHKIKEMEVQTDILKLEKELEAARAKLFNLRRQQYK
jgi:hypothetical protein